VNVDPEMSRTRYNLRRDHGKQSQKRPWRR
jgi:hypothetical protein